MMNRLLVFFALIAGIASAQSHIRTFELVTDNTTFPTTANVSWMQGESPKFSITAKYGNYYVAFSNGAAPVLKMWSGSIVTQLYAIKTGSVYNASSGKLTVELAANEANIQPAGEYNYAVGVYDGTNYMGVVAQGKATVKAHPFGASVGYVGTSSLFNFVPTNEAPVTNAYIVGSSGTGNVAKVGRRLAITFPAGGGGSGTFTNLVWNGNANTAQAIVLGESNVVLRYTGGTSYVGLASSITGDLTFNGAINANDNIEIANTKHLRFQDGGGTNTVHLEAVKGRLIITGAVDIVSGQAVPATINGSVIATGTPLYVHSETNAAARLASNVWAAADSTTNYARRSGDVITGSLTVQTNFFGISKTFSEVFQTAIDHRNSGLFFGAGRSDGGNSAGITIQQRGAGGGAVGIGYSSFGQIYGAHAWFSGLESLDNPGGFNGDFAQINFTAQDGTTSTPFSIRGNWLGGSTATVRVSKIEGDGSGLTGLIGINSGALTNLGSGLAISSGQLVSTNVSYQLGDIRIYGASTNEDATAAIASALAINNSIFIPPGTWTASNIVIAGTKTIYGVGYESRLSMAVSATGALINAAASGATVRVRGLSLSGGSEISRATNTAAGSRHGVQYATQDNLGSRFNQMWISGFTGYGIYGNEATYTGNLNDALRISEITVSNCYGGVVTAGRSELVSVTDCFAGYNAIGFRAGAGNTQIKGCTAANNGIDYDVTAAGANDAHGIINDCKAISVPARYTVRVSTNTLGFVFSGNSFYHGGILLESSKGALFVGNQISATFVADRGGGGGTNFFINNVFGTGDANTLSNSAGTIYHVGNFDINGNRMWSETEPLYSLPSSISATQLTAGTIATAIDGRNITNITAASTSGVTSISATGAVSGALTFTGTGVSQSNNVFTFTAGTGGTASASSIVAAWAVNVYQAPISTQAAYIKINFTNVEYNIGSVYNPTNFNLTLPTGWVSMAITRSCASQNARQIIPLYKNGSEMLAVYNAARFFDDVDGTAGSTGGSTHPLQFFNDSATNIFSVYCWWNTATRTNAAFRWSGTVQN